jgi:hypothetical protein
MTRAFPIRLYFDVMIKGKRIVFPILQKNKQEPSIKKKELL